MIRKPLPAWLAAATLIATPSWAGDGHDHGEAPAAVAGPAAPRFTAVSELFELVGIVEGKRLTLYLDRSADNSPVKGAKLELEVGGAKVALEEREAGEFHGTLAEEPKPGVIAVTATVTAGNDADILAGDLDVHEEAHADEVMASGWRTYALWGGVAAVAAVAVAWARRRSQPRARVGGVA
jgi:hypothetical protein